MDEPLVFKANYTFIPSFGLKYRWFEILIAWPAYKNIFFILLLKQLMISKQRFLEIPKTLH